MTSSYVYRNAAESAAMFSGATKGNVYSRFTNPTVRSFEQRLASLEKAESAIATASGMAAILVVAMTFLSAGDHVICSRGIFGSTAVLLKDYFVKFGVTVSFVELTNYLAWQDAVQKNTKLLFCETPSNPTLAVADIRRLSLIASNAGSLLVIDNTFCSPVLQNPLSLGADLVVHSVGKYIDGQGRCVGGAVVGNAALIDKTERFMRSAGPAMSAHNAWLCLKGLETLSLRMQRHSDNAAKVAAWLVDQPGVQKVYYTGLPSHSQHDLANRQQRMHGGVVSFTVKGGRREAWRFIDATQLISITTNVGDAKSMITHPASTTHNRFTPEELLAAGISEGLIRLTIGLEDYADIVVDLQRGFAATDLHDYI